MVGMLRVISVTNRLNLTIRGFTERRNSAKHQPKDVPITMALTAIKTFKAKPPSKNGVQTQSTRNTSVSRPLMV